MRNLRDEMQIRASIDQYESQEIQHERFQKFIGLGIRLLGLVFIIGLVYLGLRFSSSWIQEQWLVAHEKVEDDVQLIEISAQFRNAQNLMQAGEPIEAKILFEEIQSFDPNYPNIDFYLDQAREMAELESHYTEAVEYSEKGDLATAYQKFQAIYKQEPFYKDVSLQIDKIVQDFLLDDILKP